MRTIAREWLFAGRSRAVCMARMPGLADFGVRDPKAAADGVPILPEIDSERIGAIGFCMGGMYAITWSCTDNRLRAIAPDYVSAPRSTQVALRRLCLWSARGRRGTFTAGAARTLEVTLVAAGVRHDLKLYPGTRHSSFDDRGPAYDTEGAADSCQRCWRSSPSTLPGTRRRVHSPLTRPDTGASMTIAQPDIVEGINLLDLGMFQRGEAHEAFRILRHKAPVHWHPGTAELNGFWSITRYDDVLFVSRHPELFSSAQGISGPGLRDPETMPNVNTQPGGVSIITMDPPRHVKMRRLVNKGFTPRAVNAMEPLIRQITNTILDRIADRSSCDFVLEVASQLPLAVICGLMGLEERHWPLMFQLTNKTLGAADPEYQADVVAEDERGSVAAQTRTAMAGRAQMMEFFADILARRRKEPGEDLVSILVESEVDGEQLTDVDILAFCFLLILAGNETTRNAISGGLQVLCEHPAERARLQADPSLMDSAVEEILRWTSPLHHMSRRATADVEIRGTPIRKGESVLMWYPSANRDEDVFADPYRFDIGRQPNEHLAFGHHEHFCLGAGFAKKEMKVMFEELFRRFPGIDLEGPPERLRSNFINGIKRMPVRLA